jgi:hypothetical protein
MKCDYCPKPATRTIVYPTDPTQEKFYACDEHYIDPDDNSPEATQKLHGMWEDFVRDFDARR